MLKLTIGPYFHRGMDPGRRERSDPPGEHPRCHQTSRWPETGKTVQLPATDLPERWHNLLRVSGELSRYTVVNAGRKRHEKTHTHVRNSGRL